MVDTAGGSVVPPPGDIRGRPLGGSDRESSFRGTIISLCAGTLNSP